MHYRPASQLILYMGIHTYCKYVISVASSIRGVTTGKHAYVHKLSVCYITVETPWDKLHIRDA